VRSSFPCTNIGGRIELTHIIKYLLKYVLYCLTHFKDFLLFFSLRDIPTKKEDKKEVSYQTRKTTVYLFKKKLIFLTRFVGTISRNGQSFVFK